VNDEMTLHFSTFYEHLRYELDAEGSPEQETGFFGLSFICVFEF
jgi:hypothetical protein